MQHTQRRHAESSMQIDDATTERVATLVAIWRASASNGDGYMPSERISVYYDSAL